MIFFLIGSSSVGKSSLLKWIGEHSSKATPPRLLSQDAFSDQIRQELLAEGIFTLTTWDKEDKRRWFKELNAKTEVDTFIDTTVDGLDQVDPYLRVPYKVIMVGVNLQRLYLNIKARQGNAFERRSLGKVLHETIGIYDLVAEENSNNTTIVFSEDDLLLFENDETALLHPHGFVASKLPSALKAFRKKYFQKQKKVYVVPRHSYDFFVEHSITEKAGREILNYVATTREPKSGGKYTIRKKRNTLLV